MRALPSAHLRVTQRSLYRRSRLRGVDPAAFDRVRRQFPTLNCHRDFARMLDQQRPDLLGIAE